MDSGFLNGGHNWARTSDLIDVNETSFPFDYAQGTLSEN